MRLSDVLSRPVRDTSGRRIGRVRDVLAEASGPNPRVTALVTDGGRVPWAAVASLSRDGATVSAEPRGGGPAGELGLRRDVLDHQLLDPDGRHVTRVGDVHLAADAGGLHVAGIEVGPAPVVRRLGLRRVANRLPPRTIAWEQLDAEALHRHLLELGPGRRFGRLIRRRRAPA